MDRAGNPDTALFGMAAEVTSASALYHAAEKVRDAGYTRRVLALGLSASLNAPIGEPQFGVFRM